MGVPKDLFLSRLKEEIEKRPKLKAYEHVVIGTCTNCNKGCPAYKFIAKGFPSLPLFFEEQDDDVTDIYLCSALKVDNKNDEDEDDYDRSIFFYFYKEEESNFKPSLEHLINLQRIEKAVEAFNKLETQGIVPIQDLIDWYNRMESLAKDLKLDDFFSVVEFKAHEQIKKLYRKVDSVVSNYNKNHIAKLALEAYNQIDKKEEKNIVKWLFDNEKHFSIH